jgi:hypothetical protein
MLNLGFFKNPRFSAASGSITIIFFTMFGSIFLFTQYFQFVLGYSALGTGVRLLPWALVMMTLSPMSPRLAHRFGTKALVATGLGCMAVGVLLMTGVDATTSYADIVWRMMLMAAGMGLTMAPATESIMGSLPLAKAGVGSAVNDTTRQVGGALGVAVCGSVASSIYGSKVGDAVANAPVAPPPDVVTQIKNSLGAALAIAERFGVPELATGAKNAFVDGMHGGVIVAGGTALVGVLVALFFLPGQPRAQDIVAREAEYKAAAGARDQTPEPARPS